MLRALVLALSFGLLALASKPPRPVVVWHGLGMYSSAFFKQVRILKQIRPRKSIGDSHSSPGMLDFLEGIKVIHPGIYVHSVYIEEELDKDRKAGFVRRYFVFCRAVYSLYFQYGNVNSQVELVADQLANIPELQDGFDAIGFSQGMEIACLLIND